MTLMDMLFGKKYKEKDIDADNERYGQRYSSDPKILALRKLRNKQLDELEKARLQKAIYEYNLKRQKQFLQYDMNGEKKIPVKQARWFDKHDVKYKG